MWAQLGLALVSILKAIAQPLVLALAYMAGKRSAARDIQGEQAKKDAELNAGYAEDLARRPEPGESTGGMRRGDWPT